MAYVPLRGVRINPKNAKWALCVWIAALVPLAAMLIANYITHSPKIAFYSFNAAMVMSLVAYVITMPGMVLPFGILLAPIFLAVFGLNHGSEVWLTWWFWAFTLVCEIGGGFALVRFGKKYSQSKGHVEIRALRR